MHQAIRSLAVATALAGFACATPQDPTNSVSASQRAAIRSISISKSISVPDYPRVMGPSANAGFFLFGPLVGAATGSANNPDSQAFKKMLDDNKIDIGVIVREEFAAHLAELSALPKIVDEGGDATFQLAVELYGLAPGFSMRPIDQPLRPHLRLAAKLMSQDGKVLWKNVAYVTGMNGDIDSRKMEEILAEPARTQVALRQAAQIVVKDLLRDLGSFGEFAQPPPPLPAIAVKSSDGLRAAAERVGPLPPAGTTWVYGFADRMFRSKQAEVTVRVLRTESGVIEEAVTTKNAQSEETGLRVVQAREPRFLEHPLGGNSVLIEIAPYLLAAHDGKGPLGISQVNGYPQGQGGMPPWVVTVREWGWERIAVPAGPFQALRVEISGRRQVAVSAAGQVGRFSVVVWYSPEVKRFVKLEHRTWSTFLGSVPNGDNVVELLSYRPPS